MMLFTKSHQAAPGCLRRFGLLFFCLAAAAALQGCMPLMIARSGVTGALIVTDRRTVGSQIEDRTISLKGESAASEIAGESGHINVASFNRLVLITGEVPDDETRLKVEIAIAGIPNIRGIINELAIEAPSSLDSRSRDSLITAQVTARFLNTEGLYSNSRKTVTERGTVYLMGRLTEREGCAAAKAASTVPGVMRVVKIFEYITEEELKQIQAAYTPDETLSAGNADRYRTNPEYR
ncbi:MAG: BON domain-containing protein [Oxalobacter formigenes]|nr:BON domain-containing protein [Oxalobacter formigenes]MCM1281464.1 BON domain-containing protein [Alistipes senegalensis]MCM1513213.1 BON domain-containing protein [Oxalobacter formigenes]